MRGASNPLPGRGHRVGKIEGLSVSQIHVRLGHSVLWEAHTAQFPTQRFLHHERVAPHIPHESMSLL